MKGALWSAVPATHTQIAGIAVRDKAVADLALLLSLAGNDRLAAHVGEAWDQCRPELALNDRDCADILTALQPNPPADLQPVYEALRARIDATR